jgi:hypothetical protein
MIDQIVATRSKGNATIALTTLTKIRIKGINESLYTTRSEDDPAVLKQLQQIAADLGVVLK